MNDRAPEGQPACCKATLVIERSRWNCSPLSASCGLFVSLSDQILVILWISYFVTLIAVVEMMPRQVRSTVWCFGAPRRMTATSALFFSVLAFHGFPRLKGELHHVVVLLKGGQLVPLSGPMGFSGTRGAHGSFTLKWLMSSQMWKAVRGRLGFKKIVFKVRSRQHALSVPVCSLWSHLMKSDAITVITPGYREEG